MPSEYMLSSHIMSQASTPAPLERLPLLWTSIAFLTGIAVAGSFNLQWFEWKYAAYVLVLFLFFLFAYFLSAKARERSSVLIPAIGILYLCMFFAGVLDYLW